MNKKNLGIIIGVVVLIVGGLYMALNQQRPAPTETITSFEECVRAGYPVAESYPGQCFTPDGKAFVEEIKEEEKGL